jgi:hypothetical protein
MDESNPFFSEYDDAYEKKGATIKVAEQQEAGPSVAPAVGRTRAPSSPMRGTPLERRTTTDSVGMNAEAKPSIGGAFLTRMKSLKGGPRRTRPERRGS